MASEDVVGKSRGDTAVNTIVNLAEEAKLAREGVKGPGHQVLTVCKSLFAGGVAGGLSRTAVAPLERLKILLQVQNPHSIKYNGTVQGLKYIWRTEGLRGLFKGNGTNCARIVPNSAVKFFSYEQASRSECATLIKIIQERVVDPDSAGVIDDYIPLPISWKAEKQPTPGYSSFSTNVSSPSASPFPIHHHGFDSNAAADAAPAKTPASRGLFNHNDDNIESTKKRSYSVVRDTPEDLRRVRTKIDGNPINITKFKQVDVVRHRPDKHVKDQNNGRAY